MEGVKRTFSIESITSEPPEAPQGDQALEGAAPPALAASFSPPIDENLNVGDDTNLPPPSVALPPPAPSPDVAASSEEATPALSPSIASFPPASLEEEAPIDLDDSSTLPRIAAAFRSRGAKYFVSGVVKGRGVDQALDTGADLSVAAADDVQHLPKIKLEEPFVVNGFTKDSQVLITHAVDMEIDYNPGKLVGRFYLAPSPITLIGSDLFRDKNARLSLDTREEIMRIGADVIHTKTSAADARSELRRRRRVGTASVRGENRRLRSTTSWIRSVQRVVLPPSTVTIVSAKVDSTAPVSRVHSLFSLFDAGSEKIKSDIFIPSTCYNQQVSTYQLPVENRSDKEFVLPKNFVMAEVINHGSEGDFDEYDIYSVNEIKEELARRDNKKICISIVSPVADVAAPSAGLQTAAAADAAEPADSSSTPIPFSSIVGGGKVTAETRQQCIDRGIRFDMDLPTQPPDIQMEVITEVNVDEEKLRGAGTKFWPDRETFLNQFDFSDVPTTVLERLKDLLWDFSFIFFNTSRPDQFRSGIRGLKPIKVEKLPHLTPRKQKLRTLAPRKVEALRVHLKELEERGIIRELDDVTDCYASPVHLVEEKRWVASENREVAKSRLVLDCRELNKCLPTSSFPLPLCEEFRRKIHDASATRFSNYDAASCYFQFRMEEETSKKLFGMAALSKIYSFCRLLMGYKGAGSIVQCFMSKAFECAAHSWPFVDDISTYSADDEEHLRDTATFLAIAAHYNILLSGKKSALFKRNCRVLGHDVGVDGLRISPDKAAKIAALSFPSSKADLCSKMAFLSYFLLLAPRLSELTGRLRRLCRKSARFAPDDQDRRDFADAIAHLLDDKVCALRSPSSNVDDQVAVWTDASATSKSALVTQMLEPLPTSAAAGRGKLLHIVGVWSGCLSESEAAWPIWVLELEALFCVTRRFAWFLHGREFYILTDSMVVAYWCSLTALPLSVARRILELQKFSYKIMHVSGELNPADCFSRMSSTDVTPRHRSFVDGRVVNASGEEIPWESLFSKEKCEEARSFFTSKRNQKLSYPISASDDLVCGGEEEEDDFEDDSPPAWRAPDSIVELPPENVGAAPPSTASAAVVSAIAAAAAAARKPRKVFFAPQPPPASNDDENVRDTFLSIAAFGLSDAEMEQGLCDDVEDEMDASAFADAPLPVFDGANLENVRRLQEDDETLTEMRLFLLGHKQIPGKIDCLTFSKSLQAFFRHLSLFRISPQGVVYRLWIASDGRVDHLVVVGDRQFRELVAKTHGCAAATETTPPTGGEARPDRGAAAAASPPPFLAGTQHLGQRKTFEILSKKFYAFSGRRIANAIISSCPVCRCMNDPSTRAEKTGNQIALEPSQWGVCDFAGPMHGWASTTSGRPRYLFVYVDAFSRLGVAFPCLSTSDDDVVKGLFFVRKVLNGWPERISCDGAIMRANSRARALLTDAGVAILHGLPHVSRSQAKAEVCIKTVCKLLNKYHTADPSLSFSDLVDSAVFTYNASPHSAIWPHAPRDLHYVRAPSHFLSARPSAGTASGPDNAVSKILRAARLRAAAALQSDVQQFRKRTPLHSSTDVGRRLRPGEFVMKKKTSFPRGAAKKLCAKLVVDAYRILSRVGTNSFRVESVVDGETSIFPGDHLVRMRGHDEESVRRLCEEMERTLRRSDARASLPETRSRTRGRPAADENADVSSLSISSQPYSSTISTQLVRLDEFHDVDGDGDDDGVGDGVLEKLLS